MFGKPSSGSISSLLIFLKLVYTQARAFLQVGKHAGLDSISVAVDVATNMMSKRGVTAKFTIDELRDNITKYQCGCRGQSRKI